MIVRHVAAVVLALSLLRVNALRADVACARHEGAGKQPSGQLDAGVHEHHGQASSEEQPEEDCTTPVQAECCQALTSCSVFLELDAVALDAGLRGNDAVLTALTGMPHTTVAAPDPPPPRM